MMLKKLIYVIVAVAVAAGVWSCSSSKGAGGQHTSISGEGPDVRALAERLADNGDWQTMKIPVSVALKKPVSAKIGGSMTLVRGEEIRLSLRFFGMEVAAASITGDSVKGYVKMQKIYVAESLDRFLGGFPASIDNVQSLLLARIFQVGRTTPDFNRCTFGGDASVYTVTPPRAASGLDYSFVVRTDGNLLTTLEIAHTGGHRASVEYAYPRNVSDGRPESVAISGSLKGKPVEVEVGYSTSGIDSSAPALKPFSIPRGYRKVSASSLLKMLDSLK